RARQSFACLLAVGQRRRYSGTTLQQERYQSAGRGFCRTAGVFSTSRGSPTARDTSSWRNQESPRSQYFLRFRTFNGSTLTTLSLLERARSSRSVSISSSVFLSAMFSRLWLQFSTRARLAVPTSPPRALAPSFTNLTPTSRSSSGSTDPDERSDGSTPRATMFAPGSRPKDDASCFIGWIPGWGWPTCGRLISSAVWKPG